MKKITCILYSVLVAVLLMFLPGACDSNAPDKVTDDNSMMFYVKQQNPSATYSRSIIEDTDDLLSKGLPIYVYDEQSNFTGPIEVPYYGSGVWRKDNLRWNDSEYFLYAYIKSVGTGDGTSLTITGNGQTVDIVQPNIYVDDPEIWTDYLLSYRTSADGAGRPLVQLEFERVTAGVELYVSFQKSAAYAARVTGITFSDVEYAATMNLSRHATPSDLPLDDTGMRNDWGCQSKGIVTDYTYGTEGTPIIINGFDGTEDKYDTQYRVMRFLTIPQSLNSNNKLTINYQVQQTENGSWESYSAEFDLSEFTSSEWIIGHKTRYRMNIDISVRLEGVVEKWNTASYIEGTFLPN